ncbi:hypothetical protein SLITO_v1c10140 [Spiroplasma litorale]|uniref:Uncharacterized protein n=1 Tax=Spiroplasma litorale TaxID=216942 RepID=A0A0K1W2S3_9MOLU|nr:hypothetical protein SLITO_v1c10140 [Spiroplasma litorale]
MKKINNDTKFLYLITIVLLIIISINQFVGNILFLFIIFSFIVFYLYKILKNMKNDKFRKILIQNFKKLFNFILPIIFLLQAYNSYFINHYQKLFLELFSYHISLILISFISLYLLLSFFKFTIKVVYKVLKRIYLLNIYLVCKYLFKIKYKFIKISYYWVIINSFCSYYLINIFSKYNLKIFRIIKTFIWKDQQHLPLI